jgi:flagella basal body P-ring formation protein FlgA
MRSSLFHLSLYVVILPVPMLAGACVEIDGPVVRVAALARFVQAPHSISSDRILTETPDPGTRRWIAPAELRQWGLAPNDIWPAEGVCLQRRLQRLPSEAVVEAVQAALLTRRSSAKLIQITSFQPAVGPAGHLILPPSGFQMLSSTDDSCSFLWRGGIEYDAHRSAPVRILGRFRLAQAVFVARRDLQAGDSLAASDYGRVIKTGCSARAEVEPELPDGSILKRPLQKGDTIQPFMLKTPPAVLQGGTVRVVARVGLASVSIDAEAQRDGRRGESILVRNRESGKRIWVLLTGKGEGSAIREGR